MRHRHRGAPWELNDPVGFQQDRKVVRHGAGQGLRQGFGPLRKPQQLDFVLAVAHEDLPPVEVLGQADGTDADHRVRKPGRGLPGGIGGAERAEHVKTGSRTRSGTGQGAGAQKHRQ